MQSIPDTSPVQRCNYCGGLTDGWLWRLVEVYPERVYEKLCLACLAQQEAGFTADKAIHQATGIIRFELAVLSGRVVRDWGTK